TQGPIPDDPGPVPPVRATGDGGRETLVRHGEYRFPRGHVPDLYLAPYTSECQKSAIGGKLETRQFGAVIEAYRGGPASCRVPDSQSPLHAGGGEPQAIGADRHGIHPAVVASDHIPVQTCSEI